MIYLVDIPTDSILGYFLIGLTIIIMLMCYVPYYKNKREKLYIFDVSNKPITLRKLGFIMNEMKPDTREIRVRKGLTTGTKTYKITRSIWDIKTDFKSAFDTKISYIIIGRIGSINRDKSFNIDVSLTSEQLGVIIDAEDTLKSLNELVEKETTKELREFKNTAHSSILTMKKISEVKDELISSMRFYGQGVIDATQVIREMFGLDANEVNSDKIEQILEKRVLSEVLKNNGNDHQKVKKKKLFKKVKVVGEES